MNMKSRTDRVMVWARPSRDAPEHALVVQHDVVLVDRKLGAESAAVEVLVEITAVGGPRISLPYGADGQLPGGDPRPDEIPPPPHRPGAPAGPGGGCGGGGRDGRCCGGAGGV